ncbi:MAG: hypothetical protein N2449_06460 [Bacteroidales bacterium]|nr:hypothetical protein [Bacteroidales bacterium]
MSKIRFLIFVIFLSKSLFAQNLIIPTEKKVFQTDTFITIDSVAISPLWFSIRNTKNEIIHDSLFFVNYTRSTVILKKIYNDTLIIQYVPLNKILPTKYYHKPASLIIKDSTSISNLNNSLSYSNENNFSYFDNELQKRGSITRGIRIGNNQNMSVSSTLNLQLSGKISDDYEIVAALTDNQVPFQPSGNTQQIQEFDKIYIQIFNPNNSFTIGDYELHANEHRFLRINRKLQGLQYEYRKKNNSNAILFRTSQSVSKGKYHRMTFNGREGIQGPYKLVGANQEPFIVVLAGTERIYIDGKLLLRGENNDYIIDYNTAELTFTAKNVITKDTRIVAEFEYSDRNYARFMTFNQLNIEEEKVNFKLQLYHEFDAKNQTLQQSLTDKEKEILRLSGIDESKAVVPFITLDSIRNENQIYYRLIDTIVNGVTYDSVLVYSTDTTARYRAGFAYVGKNKGNYIQVASTANGRVFRWVAPVNGIPQGEFEPIKKLIPPMKHTIMATSLNYRIHRKVSTTIDFSISDYDKNTFSKFDQHLNKGIALRTALKHQLNKDTSKYQLNYETYLQHISSTYNSPENIKHVEFSRDWNNNLYNSNNEIMTGIVLNFKRKEAVLSSVGADWLSFERYYKGRKIFAQAHIKPNTWNFLHHGSFLQTQQNQIKTTFLRHYSTNEKSLALFKTGVKTQLEENHWRLINNDSLLYNSFSYFRWDAYLSSPDSSKFFWNIRYGIRDDFLPLHNKLHKTFSTNEAAIEINTSKTKKLSISSIITYRKLKGYRDSIKSSENIVSRNELLVKLAKNAITLNTVHENNASMEPKRQFMYVEVPAGQGTYTWIDYNKNGIKELNEFEIAQYADQATFIRITSSTLEYIKAYYSKLSQTISLNPEACWYNNSGIRKFLTNFSNHTSFLHEVKTFSKNIIYQFLPFAPNDSNLLLINTLLRNSFNILKNSSSIGMQYLFLHQQNTQLLIQGTDKRWNEQHSLVFRWNINEWYSLQIVPMYSTRRFHSEFFTQKNYKIYTQQIESNTSYQPNNETRWTLTGKLTSKINKLNTEQLMAYNFSLEMRKSIKSDNYIVAKAELIRNNFRGHTATSVAYEMLEALQPGWNQIYTLQVQRNLSSTVQMVISYQARASQLAKTIHTGNIEVRAWF